MIKIFLQMQQITNSILMIRPSSFRANEQTAVNNHYQKNSTDLSQEALEVKALKEFDVFQSFFSTSHTLSVL